MAAVSPMVMTNYAQQLYELARVDEARAYAETAYREGLRAGDDVVVNQTLLRLARIYRAQHDYLRAGKMLDEVEPRLHRALPQGHYAFGLLAIERALGAQAQGDTQHAFEQVSEGVNVVQESASAGKAGGQLLPLLLKDRASIETAAGQAQAAERDAREAVALLGATMQPGEFSSSCGRAYLALALVLRAEGKDLEARAAAQAAMEQLQRPLAPSTPIPVRLKSSSRSDNEAPIQ